MPSPKDGEAQTLVPPAEPKKPHDADKADPGEVQEAKAHQRQTQTGKYGSKEVTPFQPPDDKSQTQQTGWIAIALVDGDNKPVPGMLYRITLPDASVAEGTTDEKGEAKVEGFEPGSCKISFPQLDQEAWEPA